jgi:HEAT repeat protein
VTDATHSLTPAEQDRIRRIDRLVAVGSDSIGELIELLSDRSWTVRRAAVAALASFGADATRSLCDWLLEKRTSEHAIAAAVDALSTSIGPSATERVIDLARRGTGAVLEDAARILGRRRAFEGVPLLRELLANDNDNVALAAIEALGAIGGTASIDALVEVIETKNFFRTFPAMQVAARSGDPRVIAPLTRLLADELYQFEAARALGRSGSVLALDPLRSLLDGSDDARTRMVALAIDELWTRAGWTGAADQVFAALRQRFTGDVARFTAIVRGGDVSERRAAVRVLGAIADAKTLPLLTDLLEDPELRQAATDAIQRLARTSEAALLHAFESPDPDTRMAALPVVASARSATAVRRLLADEEPEVRARACEALARIGDTDSVPALFRALDDPHPRVAHAAAAAIHSLGTVKTPALAIAALRTGKPTLRRQALRIIAYFGGQFGTDGAFDAVRDAIADPDDRTSELAVSALGTLSDSRIDAFLVDIGASPRPNLRSAAMRAAGHRATEPMVAMLERGVEDDDAWVRYYACQGLGRIGRLAATPKLMGRLADASAHVRVAAIEALARLDTPDAWQQLMSLARSRDPDEQRAALVGIGQHSQPAAIKLLAEAAASPDVATRLIALAGLAKSSDPVALEELARAARDSTTEIRDAALSLLGERDDAMSAEILVDLASQSDTDHPVHATLSRPGTARVQKIVERLGTAREGAVAVLVAALARMHTDEARDGLFGLIVEKHPDVRRDAISALVAMGAPGAVAAAKKMAVEDADPEVRRASAAAIAG